MKKSDLKLVTVLILFVTSICGIVIFATHYYNTQTDAFKSKLLKLGYQVKPLETSTPVNCTNLSELQFLDKIKEVNATLIYYQYYTFFVFTADLKNGYTYYINK